MDIGVLLTTPLADSRCSFLNSLVASTFPAAGGAFFWNASLGCPAKTASLGGSGLTVTLYLPGLTPLLGFSVPIWNLPFSSALPTAVRPPLSIGTKLTTISPWGCPSTVTTPDTGVWLTPHPVAASSSAEQ